MQMYYTLSTWDIPGVLIRRVMGTSELSGIGVNDRMRAAWQMAGKHGVDRMQEEEADGRRDDAEQY